MDAPLQQAFSYTSMGVTSALYRAFGKLSGIILEKTPRVWTLKPSLER